MHEREREIAGMEAVHKASVALLEEQLLNAESRLARESEQCRSLEHRCGSASCACTRPVCTWTFALSAERTPAGYLVCLHAGKPADGPASAQAGLCVDLHSVN